MQKACASACICIDPMQQRCQSVYTEFSRGGQPFRPRAEDMSSARGIAALQSPQVRCAHIRSSRLSYAAPFRPAHRGCKLRHRKSVAPSTRAVNKDEGQLTISSPLKRLQTRLLGGANGEICSEAVGIVSFASNELCCCTDVDHLDACADNSVEESAEDKDVIDYKVVVALCAAVSLICSIDRASISVAIVPMGEQYGWSDSAKGAISSAFFAGYTITNLIGKFCSQLQCMGQHKQTLHYNAIPAWPAQSSTSSLTQTSRR